MVSKRFQHHERPIKADGERNWFRVVALVSHANMMMMTTTKELDWNRPLTRLKELLILSLPYLVPNVVSCCLLPDVDVSKLPQTLAETKMKTKKKGGGNGLFKMIGSVLGPT